MKYLCFSFLVYLLFQHCVYADCSTENVCSINSLKEQEQKESLVEKSNQNFSKSLKDKLFSKKNNSELKDKNLQKVENNVQISSKQD